MRRALSPFSLSRDALLDFQTHQSTKNPFVTRLRRQAKYADDVHRCLLRRVTKEFFVELSIWTHEAAARRRMETAHAASGWTVAVIHSDISSFRLQRMMVFTPSG